jgi:hypothetical protein
VKKIFFICIVIISFLFSFVTNLFAVELYDLAYRTHLLKNGKTLFVRYRNPLLDPVLRTFETYMFDPRTGKITFLQHPQEKLYILPVVSRDKSTLSYHSLIEGSDYLVTRNLQTGKSIRLRFDTSGYFLEIGIDYDNDTIVASIKRGENRQALYLISNNRGTIRRILDGRNFISTGFFYNGNPYFVEVIDEWKILGFVNLETGKRHVIAERIDFATKAPNGDVLLYSQENNLYLYRVYGNESLIISRQFQSRKNPLLLASDGSTCAVIEDDSIYIINIPSGDVMYYISMDTENLSFYLTDFTLYIIKKNKILYLEHKKPGQTLQELYEDTQPLHLLAVSQNDRYLVYQHEKKNEAIIYDRKAGRHYSKDFGFIIHEILPPDTEDSFYIIARSIEPKKKIPVKEVYLYNFLAEKLFTVSTASDLENFIQLYLTEE